MDTKSAPESRVIQRWSRLLAEFWALARPFWVSEEAGSAWALLAAVISLTLSAVYLTVRFNSQNRQMFDALQNADAKAFWASQVLFCGLALFWVLAGVSNSYLRSILQNRWRRWMTRRLLDRWLSDKSHYLWRLEGGGTDNPDQRIAEDVNDFVSQSLALSVDLLNQIVTFCSFIFILWSLSGSLEIPLGGGRSFTLPGYMAWAGLLYSAIGTWISHKIGRPLIGLNFRQQRVEADFRFALARLRENGESVALSEGEASERKGLEGLFHEVYSNFSAIIRKSLHLGMFSTGYDQISLIFPTLLAAPRYFAKAITLGVMTQGVDAFSNVLSSVSWIVTNYGTLADWSSVIERLAGFESEISLTKIRSATARAVLRTRSGQAGVALESLSLSLPGQDRPLAAAMSLEFPQGRATLVSGASGCGKSTLLRALRGIWPYAEGHATFPEGARVMVLPQKPYLPAGNLRRALAYPGEETGFSEAEIVEAMELCRLGHLRDALGQDGPWGLILSVGEQQRVAWSRVFLHRPDWLILDEATSALDEESQAVVFKALKERLPGTSVISVAHAQDPRAQNQGVWAFGSASIEPL